MRSAASNGEQRAWAPTSAWLRFVEESAMKTRRPSSRLAASLVLLLAAAPLQGCLTQKLWQDCDCEEVEEAALSTPARVALTPFAVAGDTALCAIVVAASIAPYACCCWR